MTTNWATYIWGINRGKVVEASLGYFINPLVTMLMGVIVLREQLRRLQWAALGVAAVAVAVLTIDYGRPPWVALLLPFSFGTYGLAKKQAGAGARSSRSHSRPPSWRRSPRRTSWGSVSRARATSPATARGTRSSSPPRGSSPRCR